MSQKISFTNGTSEKDIKTEVGADPNRVFEIIGGANASLFGTLTPTGKRANTRWTMTAAGRVSIRLTTDDSPDRNYNIAPLVLSPPPNAANLRCWVPAHPNTFARNPNDAPRVRPGIHYRTRRSHDFACVGSAKCCCAVKRTTHSRRR
jgi:hypothetical protein